MNDAREREVTLVSRPEAGFKLSISESPDNIRGLHLDLIATGQEITIAKQTLTMPHLDQQTDQSKRMGALFTLASNIPTTNCDLNALCLHFAVAQSMNDSNTLPKTLTVETELAGHIAIMTANMKQRLQPNYETEDDLLMSVICLLMDQAQYGVVITQAETTYSPIQFTRMDIDTPASGALLTGGEPKRKFQ